MFAELLSYLKKYINMFHQTVTDLTKQSREKVQDWLNTFDSILTEGSEVLWHNGAGPMLGSAEVVEFLQNNGKTVFIMSDFSNQSATQLSLKYTARGFAVTPQQIISTASSAIHHLADLKIKEPIYVVAPKDFVTQLDFLEPVCRGYNSDDIEFTLSEYLVDNYNVTSHRIGAVIVGFDEYFSFAKILKAKHYLENSECKFFGLNNEEKLNLGRFTIPGSATMIRAIELASARKATIIGRPHKLFLEPWIKRGSFDPEKTLVIGKDFHKGILLGYNCGCQTMLVGEHNLKQAQLYKESQFEELKKYTPDVYVPRLGDLWKKLSPQHTGLQDL